jgi:hypothetical protein
MYLDYTSPIFKIGRRAMQHAGTANPKQVEEHFKEDEAKEATEALTGQPQFLDTPVPPPNLRSSREHDLPPEPAAPPKTAKPTPKPPLTKRLPKKVPQSPAAAPTPAPTPTVTPQYPFNTDLPERAHGGAGPIAAPSVQAPSRPGLWDRIKSRASDFTGSLETQSYMNDPIIESERMKFKLGHKSASLDRVKARLKQLGVPPEKQETIIRSVTGGRK